MAPANYKSNDSSAFLHIFNPISIGGYNIYTGARLNLFLGFSSFRGRKIASVDDLLQKKKLRTLIESYPDRQ